MWTVSQKAGNIDPTFDGCELAKAAGASFVGRESMLDPKKLEKLLVKGFQHKGFSYFDILSNCHVNLGRKNKMESAMKNLEWIDSITTPLAKWEKLPEEEKMNKFPTGVLKHNESAFPMIFNFFSSFTCSTFHNCNSYIIFFFMSSLTFFTFTFPNIVS